LLDRAGPETLPVEAPAFPRSGPGFQDVLGRGHVPGRAGRFLPRVPRLGQGGAPVMLTGIGLPDDRLRAPNEKLDLQQLWDGINVFRRFYDLLGDKGV